MLSMTGYGRGAAALQPAHADRVVVELRVVNHRFLDTRLRLGPPLSEQAAVVDEVLRRRVVRGHAELSARLESGTLGGFELDHARAKAALAALERLRTDLGIADPVPLSLLSSVPDLFAPSWRSDRSSLGAALRDATEMACDELARMRAVEGRALADDLALRAQSVRELAREIADHCGGLVERLRARLNSRVARLLDASAPKLDEARLELEIALLADKADVSEELTRLDSHAAQVLQLVRHEEPVGRKLEFLLQELGREVNTIGSKVAELEVTSRVLSLKAELERMREQVQNVL